MTVVAVQIVQGRFIGDRLRLVKHPTAQQSDVDTLKDNKTLMLPPAFS